MNCEHSRDITFGNGYTKLCRRKDEISDDNLSSILTEDYRKPEGLLSEVTLV